jgi:Ca-activated chloride channel family protein
MSRWLSLLVLLASCGASRPSEAGPAAIVAEAPTQTLADADGRRRSAVAPVVIRTASLGLAVDDYDPFHDELSQWLGASGGRVADESVTRSDGRPSWASLTLRVPGAEFDPLLAWLQANGSVDRLEVHDRDVTAEWVDLDARLGALRTTEARLLALTAERTASLADVLAAESELSRVRGQIESLEGQRRVLDDQASYATVQLSVSVRTPFATAVAAPLTGEAARAFGASVRAMGEVGRAGVIAAAAVAPWLFVGVSGCGLGVLGAGAVLRAARPRRRAVAAR